MMRLPSKKFLAGLLAGSMSIMSGQARAMLIAECADPAYVEETAELVVEGEVTAVNYQRADAGHVYTFVTVKVTKYLKGEGPAVVTIKQFGGEYEENGETIYVRDADAPEFKAGEAGVLYLTQPDTAFYAGKYFTTVCAGGVSPF
jgi:hypothetical protein